MAGVRRAEGGGQRPGAGQTAGGGASGPQPPAADSGKARPPRVAELPLPPDAGGPARAASGAKPRLPARLAPRASHLALAHAQCVPVASAPGRKGRGPCAQLGLGRHPGHCSAWARRREARSTGPFPASARAERRAPSRAFPRGASSSGASPGGKQEGLAAVRVGSAPRLRPGRVPRVSRGRKGVGARPRPQSRLWRVWGALGAGCCQGGARRHPDPASVGGKLTLSARF